jgi:hypothetical protein
MRNFIITEQTLMIIIQSAADAALQEGKSFTSFELKMAAEYVSKMPGVMTMNVDNYKGGPHGN